MSDTLLLDFDLTPAGLARAEVRIRAEANVARSDAWVRIWRATQNEAEADAAGRAAYLAVIEGDA